MERRTSVGGFIWHWRNSEVKLTQAQVCEILGWDPFHLSDLEKDKVRPKKEELELLFGLLQLTHEAVGQGYFLAGIAPTEEELNYWIDYSETFLDAFDMPVMLRNFTGKLLNVNSAANRTFPFAKNVRAQRPQWLEVLFDKSLREIPGWDEQLQKHIAIFVADTPFDAREDWYRELLKRMYKNPQFPPFWVQANDDAEYDQPILDGYREVTMPTIIEEGVELTDFTRLSRPASDIRFRIDVFVPKAA